MTRRRYLSQKQLAVLDDLFNSDLDEQGVLKKHRVRRSTYDRWLGDELFAARFLLYVNGLKRRSELLMAKYGQLAAAKLVELTTSGKEETARKACLDIISLPKLAGENNPKPSELQQTAKQQTQPLSDKAASKLLAMLAEEKEKTAK